MKVKNLQEILSEAARFHEAAGDSRSAKILEEFRSGLDRFATKTVVELVKTISKLRTN